MTLQSLQSDLSLRLSGLSVQLKHVISYARWYHKACAHTYDTQHSMCQSAAALVPCHWCTENRSHWYL